MPRTTFNQINASENTPRGGADAKMKIKILFFGSGIF